jgi:D-alanine--poly(phosphoribitol) ligase subunit 2
MIEDTTIRNVVLKALAEICATDEILNNPHLDLFADGLLDSFGTVELMLIIHEQLGIDIAPTELDRDMWSTPEKIIRYLEEKKK